MSSDTLFFDGPALALTMQQVLGMESRTPLCFRCGAVGEGTAHACFCRAEGIAGHNTKLERAMRGALAVSLGGVNSRRVSEYVCG
jgi:hypothetical protein